MPLPLFEIAFIAKWSWSPQSQRAEPKTSPVRHCEWMRTKAEASFDGFPITRARTFSLLSGDSNPKIRKAPNFVGSPASATFNAFIGRIISRAGCRARVYNDIVRCERTAVGTSGTQVERGSGRGVID